MEILSIFVQNLRNKDEFNQILDMIREFWVENFYSIKERQDLNRIEEYVEMVLTFLRLDSDSTDYLIKEYDLDSIIRTAVRKFSREFILKRNGQSILSCRRHEFPN